MSKDYLDSLSGSSLLKSSTLKILAQLTLSNTSTNSENKSTATKLKNSNSLIKSFSYREEKNLKYRKTMEDFGSTDPNLTSDYNISLFGIYDGHGGTDVVKYIKERLPQIIKENLINRIPIETALTNSFTKVDEELKFYDSDYTGSTATIVLIQNNKIYCANVGDSRAYLLSKEHITQISTDHKCTDEDEADRITQSGGNIQKGRVNGQLILSRTLGDLNVKKFGIIATPTVRDYEINKNETFCVLASDGVWDVIDGDSLLQMSKEFTLADDFAKALVKNAIERGSRDNISCIVLSFI